MLKLVLIFTALSLVSGLTILPRDFPNGNVTCGKNVYSVPQVTSAVSTGFDHMDEPIGRNKYPHRFSNREGLEMSCPAEDQFFEFPILPSGTYTGAAPGPDRVVFGTDGVPCAVLTHTGAGGNNFVSCLNG